MRCSGATTEYGSITAGPGASRKPAFRVSATTPTIVTSGGASRVDQRRGRRLLQDAEAHPRANRILARRPQPGRRLVDQRDAVAAQDFRRIEHPAATQRDAERPQVIGTDEDTS